MHVGAGVSVYAAQDPTAAYTFTDAVDLAAHAYVDFMVTPSGTAPTSYQCKVQTSQDGSIWGDVPLVVEISAGAVPLLGTVIDLLDTDGTVLADRALLVSFTRRASRYVRLALKSTGGAGTDRLAVVASKGN